MSIVRLLLLSQATNAESDDTFYAWKRVKTYLRSTMGNNLLHALMLVHVYNNILDNIKLADARNQFFERKGSRKQTFRYLSQNYSLEL